MQLKRKATFLTGHTLKHITSLCCKDSLSNDSSCFLTLQKPFALLTPGKSNDILLSEKQLLFWKLHITRAIEAIVY